MLQKYLIFVTSENDTVCQGATEGSLYSSSMTCTMVSLSLPLFPPTLTFPSLLYLMSKNLFNSTDVSSGGYVNI